jgi:Zn-finger nucleic acid-binding protein
MKLSDYNGTTPSDEGRARCPQCQEMLEIVDRRTVVGYACTGCGGIWLDSATTSRVEQTLDTQTIQVGEIASGLSQNPCPPHEASPPCPICTTPMRSYVVPGSDVEVDACDEHGTWFDRGELQTLMHELMARVNEMVIASSAPPQDVRQKMIDRYGIDPTLTPGHCPKMIDDLLEMWAAITRGHFSSQ